MQFVLQALGPQYVLFKRNYFLAYVNIKFKMNILKKTFM